jgi:hypothetical protein
MPVPMEKRGIEKTAENATDLPIDIARGLSLIHINFYLQNRDKMKIVKDNGKIWYEINDSKLRKEVYNVCSDRSGTGHGFIFEEKDMNKYFKVIGFQPNLDKRYKTD